MTALTGWSAWKSPRAAARSICSAIRRAHAVDLVEDEDDRSTAEHPLGDEAVAGPDRLVGGQHEEDAVEVLERFVDRTLHAPGERVPRALEPGQVDEHELVRLAVEFSVDTAEMRRRVVCGLSETIATLPPASAFTSVDLPTLAARDRDQADFTGRTSPEAAPGCA